MMKTMFAGLIGLALAGCASTATAPETADVVAAETTKVAVASVASEDEVVVADAEAVEDPDEIICRKDKLTGSNVRTKKVCGTRAEWDKMYENSRKRAHDSQRYRQLPDANR